MNTKTGTAVNGAEVMSFFVPMRLGRRCGRKMVITPDAKPEPGKGNAHPPVNPMVLALARAVYWQGMLDAGEYANKQELARALGLDRSFINRILNLACLAPDIVEAILDEREPLGLSKRAFLETVYPDDWVGQRRVFGFPEIV